MSEFEKEFYDKAIEKAGVTYNYYGFWQKSYAKMIISITNIIKAASENQKNSLVLDIGCACGVILKGFKETKVFNKYIGVDISEYMIDLGKKTHGFNDEELIVCDIAKENLPLDDNSVTLINCTYTLNYLDKEDLKFTLKEMSRVLNPDNGIAFIIVPTISNNSNKKENSKYILETMTWWKVQFMKYFKVDMAKINKNFKESEFSPTSFIIDKKPEDKVTFYDYYKDIWTVFALRSKK